MKHHVHYRVFVFIVAPISTSVTNANAKWMQNGVTVAGGNSQGNRNNQLSNPWSVYVDDDQTIYVADYSNHRIVEWKKDATTGQIVAGVKEAGNRNDQLNSPANVIVDKKNDSLIICDRGNQRVVRWPRRNGTSGETIISNVDCYGLSIDNDGCIYVSDVSKHEVRRWKIGETNGTLVAGGNGKGDHFNQLKQPYHIFVDQDHSVYVSDWGNHRVMKWMQGAKEGILVAGGQNLGDRLTQLSGPRGIIVDQKGDLYVADQNNHRVMRWVKEATEGTVVVGGNKPGGQANQFNTPVGLSFDQQNNLYVVDQGNQRIQKFNIESNPTS
jgi:sugar lactone lactonase YvrE